MSVQTWLLFAAAYLVTTLTPGPNVLLVVRNTVRYGGRGTAVTIAGNLVAQLGVVVLVALGVGAVLAAMPPLFIAMKIVGAIYLMYLGVKQLRGPRAAADAAAGMPLDTMPDRRKLFREALLVSASNPKTLVFLSAFMPQFIAHDRSLPLQFAEMYLTVASCVVIVHCVYSAGVRRLHRGFAMTRWVHAIKRGSGLLFVALGIRLLTARQA